MNKLRLIACGCLLACTVARSADYVPPMPIKMELSANFGELRANHFHSGLDLKTQKAIGQPVYAIDDGYLVRINISATGYGNCLYVAHPGGYTSVYAHLDHFLPFIDSIAKNEQYRRESFAIDYFPEIGSIPVKRGQQIAVSGNSGSSGGPHLHFEIRDSRTQDALDPQIFFPVEDNVAPRPRMFRIVPFVGEGTVRGKDKAANFDLLNVQSGKYRLKNDTVRVWGKVGLAVKAYDHMPEQSNIYGIYRLQVFVDDSLKFEYLNDRISFAQTRMINSLIDYPLWYQKGEVFMRTWLLPGNELPLFPVAVDNGVLTIDEARDYKVRIVMSDRAGNKAELGAVLRGVPNDIKPLVTKPGQLFFSCADTNRYEGDGVRLDIPAKALYEDLIFDYARMADSTGLSDIYQLSRGNVPMQKYAALRIQVNEDSITDWSKCYVARVGRKGGWDSVGGKYVDGWMETSVRDLGTFKVMTDTVPPVITLLGKGAQMRFKVSDKGTGIAKYRGTVDGKWALFAYDAKNATLKYVFDSKRVTKGKTHTVEMTVTDCVGNTATQMVEVWW